LVPVCELRNAIAQEQEREQEQEQEQEDEPLAKNHAEALRLTPALLAVPGKSRWIAEKETRAWHFCGGCTSMPLKNVES